jgi:acyl carrier protein
MGLDILEAFMAVEQAFGIEVPDAEAARMGTVGSLFNYLRGHV